MLQAEAQDLRYKHDEIIASWKARAAWEGLDNLIARKAPAGHDRMALRSAAERDPHSVVRYPMISRRELWEYRKKRSTIFGMVKSLSWWLHRVKKKILFRSVNTVARTGTP